ncbi:MAG: hypothetical protein AB7V50_07695, partial [Vampirovibrionia bacterium]
MKKIDFDFICFDQILPFTLFDENHVVVRKKGEKITPEINRRLIYENLYCLKQDFLNYIFKNYTSEHFNY